MAYTSTNLLTLQKYDPEVEITEYTGDPCPGDGYFGKLDGIHTIQYSLTDFIGAIIFQVALVFEPTEDDWATIYCKEHELYSESESVIENIIGNFIWVRAGIRDWKHGSVNVIRMKT